MLLLSGSLHSVLTAIFLILEKITRDSGAGKGGGPKGGRGKEEDEHQAPQVRPATDHDT